MPLIAFAAEPADARSACIAVLECSDDPESAVRRCRETGAPVVFACLGDAMQWWKQGHDQPRLLDTIPGKGLDFFFSCNKGHLSPSRVYEAKTRGFFDKQYQLDFVDLGLMPVVENEIGERLTRVIERSVQDLKSTLRLDKVNQEQGHWLLQRVFWLVAAKILRDKQVPQFANVGPANVDALFSCVATHYGARPIPIRIQEERAALQQVAGIIDQHAPLSHVTTESLAYVYESTLISKETRSRWGTHSTPAYIADYLVWHLLPWIEEMPLNNREVFEPACGHAVFLVSAMRAMRQLLPDTHQEPARRHRYFRERLHGVDVDAFALEIARVSLTLADIPNPNGWDLQSQDVFVGQDLQERASRCMVLLANPPFENFTVPERGGYSGLKHSNKTVELLARALPRMQPGAAFGLVVPQTLLHSHASEPLRDLITKEFELQEICLLPDGVFEFSDAESALLIGRRMIGAQAKPVSVRYRRVRDRDVARFRESYATTTDRVVQQERFADAPDRNLRLPDLEWVWAHLADLRHLGDIVQLGQGLFYRGSRNLPSGAPTVSTSRFPGAVRGFAGWRTNAQIHGLPEEIWMNLDPSVVDRRVTGADTGIPQILLNYARVRRGPWCMEALIDREGHAVTSRFITARSPRGDVPLEFLWAVCNSPLASAYAYAHTMKRDMLVGLVRKLPVPSLTRDAVERVCAAARRYLDAAISTETHLGAARDKAEICDLLLRLDAEVLRLYELPPRYERQILDLFGGWDRPGVPVRFCGYFPDDFQPCIGLHDYLSEDYVRSTAGALSKRYEPVKDPDLLQALRHAREDFGD